MKKFLFLATAAILNGGQGLSDIILKGTHPWTIPARFDLIWFIGFRGEDLNVICYQNMPNLHNRYKSAERKIWWPSWLEVRHKFGRGPSMDHSTKVWLQLAQWFLRRRLKCEMLTDGRRTKSDDNSSHGLKARRPFH